MAKFVFIKIFITLIAKLDLELFQVDIKIVFVIVELKKPVTWSNNKVY